MGLLMVAGLIGTMVYGTYFIKNETNAMIGDSVIQPSYNIEEDKNKIANNFELICKRCGVKLDKNKNPTIKKGYNICVAYLQYQGFHKDVSEYFKEIYSKKYRENFSNTITDIQLKHSNLMQIYGEQSKEKQTKIFRYWSTGNTKEKCDKMMKNILWGILVDYCNIVKDGSQNVEIWSITAPPSILRQIDEIYEEVLFLESR